jgi:predicted transcriptional regulator
MNLRVQRNALGISQSKLTRISGVSRFKICTYELGGGSLTPEEHGRVREALLNEANRLRDLPTAIDLGAQGEVR